MSDSQDKKSSQRLPVNPRRHKVAPEHRKRVATACNSCNVRRIKCSGEKPCKQCRSSSRECVYPDPVEKVSISKAELDDLRRQVERLDKALQEVVPDSARRKDLLQLQQQRQSASSPVASSPTLSLSTTTGSIKSESVEDDQVSGGVEGRLLRDQVGSVKFLGSTSETVFLDALKECFAPHAALLSTSGGFMSSAGLYETNDSHTIEASDVDPLWLPPTNQVRVVLAELRHLIQDGGGEWPSGGIQWWGDLTSAPPTPIVNGLETPNISGYRHLAFYHAALAVACRATISKAVASKNEPPLCETYFARAAMLLENPLDVSKFTFGDAATMALMAWYLVESDRLETAYMWIGTAMRVSLMQGAHRGFVDESGKRVFWTIYNLDRWIGSLTGRPSTVPDEAIRLTMPTDHPGLPPSAGLRAHIELSRVSDHIVNNVHNVSPQTDLSPGSGSSLDRALAMLEHWRNGLSPELSLSSEGLSHDPAVCQLHMMHNQLLILATRSWLLAGVKSSLSMEHPRAPTTYLKICTAAARYNIRLGRHLSLINQSRRLLHTSIYLVLNAAICVLLQELLHHQTMTPVEVTTGHRMVDFVTEKLDEEGNLGNSYARSGANTLRELRGVIVRLIAARSGLLRGSMDLRSESGMSMSEEELLSYDDLMGIINHDWHMEEMVGM